MRLAVGICFYQDVKGLERLLSTLPPKYIDYVFAIDGKFTELDDTSLTSTDGSRELFFHQHYDHITLKTVAGSETDKRNAYLRLCELCNVDLLLIIDSDEFVVDGADWKAFKENAERLCKQDNIYGVRYWLGTGGGGYDIRPRLWYKPGDMEYYQNHNIFRNKRTGQIFRSAPAPLIDGITIDTNDALRSPEYVKKVYDYQVKLIKKEKAIKKQFRQGRHS